MTEGNFVVAVSHDRWRHFRTVRSSLQSGMGLGSVRRWSSEVRKGNEGTCAGSTGRNLDLGLGQFDAEG